MPRGPDRPADIFAASGDGEQIFQRFRCRSRSIPPELARFTDEQVLDGCFRFCGLFLRRCRITFGECRVVTGETLRFVGFTGAGAHTLGDTVGCGRSAYQQRQYSWYKRTHHHQDPDSVRLKILAPHQGKRNKGSASRPDP